MDDQNQPQQPMGDQGTGMPAGGPMTPPPAEPTTPAEPMQTPGTGMGGDTTPPAPQPGQDMPAGDDSTGGDTTPPAGMPPTV